MRKPATSPYDFGADMANILLGYPNRCDEATLTGGNWSGAPLSNLQTRVYSETAVSANTLATSTQFDAALSSARPIQIVALAGHNLSPSATWRVMASNTAGDYSAPLYNSSFVMVYPTLPFGTYDWNDSSFWSGSMTTEQRSYYPSVVFIVLPSPIITQYWRIEIVDTANPAGNVAIGRLFLCPAWEPSLNATWGLQWSHETATQVEQSLGSVEFFDKRPMVRSVKFALDMLSDSETYGPGFDLVRRQGVDAEVFFVFDPADALYSLQRSFPARMRALPTYVVADYARNTTAFDLKELI